MIHHILVSLHQKFISFLMAGLDGPDPLQLFQSSPPPPVTLGLTPHNFRPLQTFFENFLGNQRSMDIRA